MKLLLATSNSAKLARLRALLEGLPLELVEPRQVGPEPRVDEGSQSLRHNAEAKACAWAAAYGMAAVATDGGLVVPALADGWNPALTRRAAGAEVSDEQRALHLLDLMRSLRGEDRLAYSVEAAALAAPGGQECESWEARGPAFRVAERYAPRGVPPGFWVPGIADYGGGRRFGDLSEAERQQAESHWSRLRAPLRDAAQRLLGQPRR